MSPDIVSVIKAINKIEPSRITRKDWVKYLVIRDFEKIEDIIIKGDPGAKFGEIVAGIVNGYMVDKKPPPREIAPAILNITDDILSGREPVLRAGDYISLQTYVRKQTTK